MHPIIWQVWHICLAEGKASREQQCKQARYDTNTDTVMNVPTDCLSRNSCSKFSTTTRHFKSEILLSFYFELFYLFDKTCFERASSLTWSHCAAHCTVCWYKLYTAFFFLLALLLSFMGNLGHLTRVKLQQLQEQRYLLLTVHAVFLCVQTKVWLPMPGILICTQMLVHVIAHESCTDTVRESALEVDWEKNPLPHPGIEPASGACQSDALSTELHPHPHLLKWIH